MPGRFVTTVTKCVFLGRREGQLRGSAMLNGDCISPRTKNNCASLQWAMHNFSRFLGSPSFRSIRSLRCRRACGKTVAGFEFISTPIFASEYKVLTTILGSVLPSSPQILRAEVINSCAVWFYPCWKKCLAKSALLSLIVRWHWSYHPPNWRSPAKSLSASGWSDQYSNLSPSDFIFCIWVIMESMSESIMCRVTSSSRNRGKDNLNKLTVTPKILEAWVGGILTLTIFWTSRCVLSS